MLAGLPLTERNLILTGYTGPNQPRIGQQIAAQLRMPYINIEGQIAERVNLSIDEVRQFYGDTRLKSVEADIMAEAMLRRHTLLRVSARTLLHANNLTRLSETGPVICLVTTLDAMLQRLHMAMGARYYNPEERAVELGNLKREWAVRGQESIIEIDTTYLSTDAVVERVVSRWQEVAIART